MGAVELELTRQPEQVQTPARSEKNPALLAHLDQRLEPGVVARVRSYLAAQLLQLSERVKVGAVHLAVDALRGSAHTPLNLLLLPSLLVRGVRLFHLRLDLPVRRVPLVRQR